MHRPEPMSEPNNLPPPTSYLFSFLAKKCDELGAEYVFTIDGSDCNIANAVVSSTRSKDQKIAALYSMQSVRMNDKKPAGYCETMRDNLNTLKEALN